MSKTHSITDFPLRKQTYRSRPEREFGQWLLSKFPHALVNSRVHIAPKELDFVLEEEGIAIEFNGDYWHSDAHLIPSKGVTAAEAHEQKSELATKAGLNLLFVWESDWAKHRDAICNGVELAAKGKNAPKILTKLTRNRPVKTVVSPKLRRRPVLDPVETHGNVAVSYPKADSFCYALASEAAKRGVDLVFAYPWTDRRWIEQFAAPRKSEELAIVRPVSSKEARSFYEQNCFLGGHRSTTDSIGAFVRDELVACVSFTEKPRTSIVRMGEKTGMCALQALSGIIASRLTGESMRIMVDYSDSRFAPMLESLGFCELAPTGASLMWYRARDNKTVPSSMLQRLGADRLLGTSYGPREVCGLNNEGIMKAEGFVAYRTAGNRVFEWRATT